MMVGSLGFGFDLELVTIFLWMPTLRIGSHCPLPKTDLNINLDDVRKAVSSIWNDIII
jgi:hypothetical protein